MQLVKEKYRVEKHLAIGNNVIQEFRIKWSIFENSIITNIARTLILMRRVQFLVKHCLLPEKHAIGALAT